VRDVAELAALEVGDGLLDLGLGPSPAAIPVRYRGRSASIGLAVSAEVEWRVPAMPMSATVPDGEAPL